MVRGARTPALIGFAGRRFVADIRRVANGAGWDAARLATELRLGSTRAGIITLSRWSFNGYTPRVDRFLYICLLLGLNPSDYYSSEPPPADIESAG